MLTGLDQLALEVRDLDRAREFYTDRLALAPAWESEHEVAFALGQTSEEADAQSESDSEETDAVATQGMDDIAAEARRPTLVLRRPESVPRGGLHTHYAFATTPEGYDAWRDRLADLDPAEHDFGAYQSLYVDDPDGHCVEIGSYAESVEEQAAEHVDSAALSDIFEIVLEVEDVQRAEACYTALGFEVVDRGDDRPRIRLRGPFDLELWEPQVGIAGARGGVHVALQLRVEDTREAVNAVDPWTDGPWDVEGGYRVRDADGHYLTFVE